MLKVNTLNSLKRNLTLKSKNWANLEKQCPSRTSGCFPPFKREGGEFPSRAEKQAKFAIYAIHRRRRRYRCRGRSGDFVRRATETDLPPAAGTCARRRSYPWVAARSCRRLGNDDGADDDDGNVGSVRPEHLATEKAITARATDQDLTY